MERTATISDDGIYRYDLIRTVGKGAKAVFVLLNPSTADEGSDDPTVAAVLRFAVSMPNHSVGTVTIVNLFALRTTGPALLRSHPDPVGLDNDARSHDTSATPTSSSLAGASRDHISRTAVTSVLHLMPPTSCGALGPRARATPAIHNAWGVPRRSFFRLGFTAPGHRPADESERRNRTERGSRRGFSTWLRSQGRGVETEVDWADVVATRGVERLVAEAKGSTSEPNLDIDTAYGQLLRRMREDSGGVRYAIVVPERHVALRVPEVIRRILQLDVYVVDEAGKVTVHRSR